MQIEHNTLEPQHARVPGPIRGKRSMTSLWCMLAVLIMVHPVQADDIITLRPYVQNVTPTSMVIMWQTAVPMESRVVYGASLQEGIVAVDEQPVTRHEVTLVDLEPDTVYWYSVKVSDQEVFDSTFQTAPDASRSFRFVVYGDSRTSPDDHRAVVRAIVKNRPELVLHTGDLVAVGERQETYGPEFFEPAYDLLHHTPVFPILGNHEYWYSGRSWFSSFFSLPNNEQWFAFTYSNVRFIGLDSNVSFYPDSPQYRWLQAEIESEPYQLSTWRIVYFHHPPFTASRYSDDIEVNEYLLPLFEAGRVDMVFSGHAHAYERYAHQGIQYIVTGGGGTHVVQLVEDTEPPLRLVGKSLLHHCVLDVNVPDGSLTVSVQKNDGTPFDGLTLTKPLLDPNLPGDLPDDPNLAN